MTEADKLAKADILEDRADTFAAKGDFARASNSMHKANQLRSEALMIPMSVGPNYLRDMAHQALREYGRTRSD